MHLVAVTAICITAMVVVRIVKARLVVHSNRSGHASGRSNNAIPIRMAAQAGLARSSVSNDTRRPIFCYGRVAINTRQAEVLVPSDKQ